jgi:hypothetical protein
MSEESGPAVDPGDLPPRGSAPQSPANPPAQRPGATVNWQRLASHGTLILAVAGTAWFGLLSLAAALVYGPVGVRPSEVGLGSATLLAQAAVGVIVAVLVTVAYSSLMLGFIWVLGFVFDRLFGSQSKSLSRRDVVELAGALAVFSAAGFVLQDALDARNALKEGRTAAASVEWFRNPWSAEIAYLAWAHDPPQGAGTLPPCALYLGAADGTSVFYDTAVEPPQVWRIASPDVIVRTKPSLTKCP